MVLLISVSSTVFSQTTWYKIQSICVNVNDGNGYGNWVDFNTPIDMSANFDTKHIEIHTPKVQVIDFVLLKDESTSEVIKLTAYATDTDYKTIRITILKLVNNATNFFIVEYSDVSYMYALKN